MEPEPRASLSPEPLKKSKSASELLRENMPDRGIVRFNNWIQHLFKTFGKDVVTVMVMVYVMQGARTSFLVSIPTPFVGHPFVGHPFVDHP